MQRTSARPLRTPDLSSPEFMTRRAWWLIVANLLVPGAGPLLAGNRRFGRAGLRLWLFCLFAIIAVVALWFLLRSLLLFPLTTSWGLRLTAWFFLGYGIWMAVTMVETLRQARLIRVDALARGLVLVVALVSCVTPVFVGGFVATQLGVVRNTVENLFGGPNGGLKMPTDGRINIMLLGGDEGEDREGVRPDSISVMSFDVVSGRLTTIGLPRTLTDFGFVDGPMKDMYPDDYSACNVDVCYLNSVYTEVTVYDYDMYPDAESKGSEPGIEATRDAVEWITGLDIHYYVMINMQGFADGRRRDRRAGTHRDGHQRRRLAGLDAADRLHRTWPADPERRDGALVRAQPLRDDRLRAHGAAARAAGCDHRAAAGRDGAALERDSQRGRRGSDD
jgi:hypothetical protein